MIASPTENWTSVIELGEDNKRYKDVLNATMKSCGVPHNTWEATTSYMPRRSTRLRREEVRRSEGEENEVEGYPASIEAFACHVCGRLCAPRIGVHNHKRTHATD